MSAVPAAIRIEHPAKEAARMFARNPAAVAGAAMLLLVVAIAVFGPLVYDADPFAITAMPMSPPFSQDALLGTDYLGRDILT
ncbi:MAG: ABC transporter permease, partial [Betaproteobacteria bacterium]|nr:ABC transporter permease [Betaproteobacteria bacterium]